MKSFFMILLSALLSSCASLPDNVEPVSGFELEKYLGKWFEIARLDHRFERGLENVTATYSMNEDGSVLVENRGFLPKKNEWKDAQGKAKFAGESTLGYLEVSFFGPFYGPYVIFELDKAGYQYAFVTSGEEYLWFLSRSPTVSDELRAQFLKTANDLGYNTEDLIFVNQ